MASETDFFTVEDDESLPKGYAIATGKDGNRLIVNKVEFAKMIEDGKKFEQEVLFNLFFGEKPSSQSPE
jgi:hypothetical protein